MQNQFLRFSPNTKIGSLIYDRNSDHYVPCTLSCDSPFSQNSACPISEKLNPTTIPASECCARDLKNTVLKRFLLPQATQQGCMKFCCNTLTTDYVTLFGTPGVKQEGSVVTVFVAVFHNEKI
jgi:hypothetical protein